MSTDWTEFWNNKAAGGSDFQATGRGLMDVPGYLHTVAEVVRLLDLRQGEELADIGCGTGLISLSLAPWLGYIYAMDISDTMIERARSNLGGMGNIELKVGSLVDIPLQQACVDKLLAYSTLQYLKTEEAAILAFQEIARVTRSGGKALVAANPHPDKRHLYEKIVKARPDKASAEKELAILDDLLWISGDRLAQLAANVGLKAKIEPLSTRIWQHFYMYNLVLEKIE